MLYTTPQPLPSPPSEGIEGTGRGCLLSCTWQVAPLQGELKERGIAAEAGKFGALDGTVTKEVAELSLIHVEDSVSSER